MNDNFKKTTPNYKPIEPAETPYQKAKQVWDHRIGDSRIQAENWRFTAILSLIISLVLLILLIISLSLEKDHVFIAEVSNEGRVVNVAPLTIRYEPTLAQKEYFISQFVKLSRELPLDPVVAKQNWLNAYGFLSQRASEQLNTLFKVENPLASLGKKTITVVIADVNPVSNQTIQVDWIETATNNQGTIESKITYSGVFTLAIKQPVTQKEILSNPLGIFITDFHFSKKEIAT
ncbi:MAG: hypothetical protein A2103_05790 [Gammaproteobacteria bacterium GWF2_41_13]|nr:MAG: hypothetical protein A2103_05790 [Gammaproteobacteria bacterium GWF2_41_13]